MPVPTPVKRWKWTKERLDAVQMVVDGKFSYVKIAKDLGINIATLEDWRITPEFEAKRKELLVEFTERVMSQGIALRANRIAALDRLNQAHTRIVEQRIQAAPARAVPAPTEGGINEGTGYPGLDTGLVIIEEKMAGYDSEGKAIFRDQLVFDQSLSREYRATLAQVAEETGQLVSKHELTGKDGGPLAVTVGVMDQVAERVRLAKQRASEDESQTKQA